ncbi:MAG: hypothetical protein J0I45_16190 [Bosea sp.]|nr:hypothetical protein [Bosea sp. (in: a-proteobacteria)]
MSGYEDIHRGFDAVKAELAANFARINASLSRTEKNVSGVKETVIAVGALTVVGVIIAATVALAMLR